MPLESGLYFAWAETSGYTVDEMSGGVSTFNSNSYKWYSGSTAATKYNSSDGLAVREILYG